MDNQKQNNSLFLYTALIFIVAIVIIILAFFAQEHLEMLRPAATESPQITEEPSATSEPQGIAKTAAELSQDNLELLNENRDLNKKLDSAEDEIEVYQKLLAANGYMSVDNKDEAKKLLDEIDYDNLTSDGKILYDQINSNIQ